MKVNHSNMPEIINKVAQSGLITIDLEEYYPQGERMVFDIKDWLFEGLILKENDFREKILKHEWSQYENKFVAITCSADAIVPTWAFMLLAVHLEPVAKKITFGNLEKLEEEIFDSIIAQFNSADFKDQKVVIKGCSNKKIPVSVYIKLTTFLRPLAKSIMYGEPCSTVPLYKKNKAI
jgi:hypothetical protein